jgi:GTP cyclohydrolase I
MPQDKDKTLYNSIEALLLHFCGNNLDPEVIQNTPKRFIGHLASALEGYKQSPEKILGKTFPNNNGYESFISSGKINFTSTCQHHILPIIGNATIAYFPSSRILGLSKLARLVDVFASRLQLQEKMTQEIGTSIDQHLETNGVAVRICANHLCMNIRGPKKSDAYMETFYFSGKFKEPEQQRLFIETSGPRQG